MRGVRDELALGTLAPLLDGHIREHDDGDGWCSACRKSDDRITQLCVELGPLLNGGRTRQEERAREVAQLDCLPVGELHSGLQWSADEISGRVVGELDGQIAVHRHHAVVKPLEKDLQPVALGAELGERVAQPDPHAVHGGGEVAELVAKTRVEVFVEASALDLHRNPGDPS